jgi:hypothetical protein
MSVDPTGVLMAVSKLEKTLTEYGAIGQVLRNATNAIWIPNIKQRLFKSTSTSGYSAELGNTMYELDPDFVNRIGSNRLRSVTEGERRAPGGYIKGEISELIEDAIKAETASAVKGHIAIGVGNLDKLNNIMPHLGADDGTKIWQILNYGTGIYYNGSPTVRIGLQIFFNRKIGKGVIAQQTSNEGFKGREFFVQLDNTMHESDYLTKDRVIDYMMRVVKKYSYK